VAIIWSLEEERVIVRRVLLSSPEKTAESRLGVEFPLSSAGGCPEILALSNRFLEFLNGKPEKFSLESIALDLCSDFQKSVLMAEYGIPRGSVSTYRRIGMHLGFNHAARAVGNALARNPFPIVIPCHRAVRSDNSLGGFQGGVKMKQRLLELEGHRFDNLGRLIEPHLVY
jgi:methylated-DNA-[protein]-cysteine S-methyltransferase